MTFRLVAIERLLSLPIVRNPPFRFGHEPAFAFGRFAPKRSIPVYTLILESGLERATPNSSYKSGGYAFESIWARQLYKRLNELLALRRRFILKIIQKVVGEPWRTFWRDRPRADQSTFRHRTVRLTYRALERAKLIRDADVAEFIMASGRIRT